MLERIEEIQGVGLLHQANGKPYTCHKATLIYGDNGRGKSTVATVLRSVSTGTPELIVDRKTVDGTLSPKVVLQFGSGHKVTFDGAWSERRSEVLVFDSDFIERNVYSGSTVSTGHRKNLLEFALGEPAVAARAAVDKATGEAKVASDKVQFVTAQLSGHHPGMALTQFEKIAPVTDIDAKIAELQKGISAAANVEAILARPVPNPISEPLFDIEGLFTSLSTSLKDIHADAEHVVKQHVAKLGSPGAESWLSQGHQFDDTQTCPYCGQGTSGNDLILAYKTHFNEFYNKLKSRVASLHEAVVHSTASTMVDVIAQTTTTAATQIAVWSDQVQTQPIVLDADAIRMKLAVFKAMVIDLTNKKLASPAEPLGNPDEKEKAKALWEQVIAPIKAVNSKIKATVDLINKYKGQLATVNVMLLKQQLQNLQATKRRYDPQVLELLGKLAMARSAVVLAEAAKKAARENLDTLMSATLKQYETQINSLLKDFGASFKIKGMAANFRGAAPRSEYGLSLRGKDIALEGGSPSFATTLSEGDKRTLAFAFFIASTQSDPNLDKRIVVIDDPMCSLDLNRKHHTRTVLKKIFIKAKQLIVLAHDGYFLRDLRDVIRKEDTSSPIAVFQLAPAPGDYTTFAPFDIDKECESLYFQHHRLLNEFAAGKSYDTKAVAKAIRPMLEGYLHRRFPGLIPRTLLFGQVVALIKAAVEPSPLCHAACLVDTLNEINDYAGQFHHDTNPGSADTVVITASELKTFVEKALALVHKGA